MTGKELDLIDAWLDDDLSDDDVARLEAWMRAEPGHLEAFARAGLLHRRLRDLLRAQAVTGNVAGIENGRETAGAEPEVPGPADSVPFPFIVVDSSGPLTASRFALDSSLRGWIFSYAAATVITCMAILGAWVYKVSHDYQLVKYLSPPASSLQKTVEPEPACVGRITGMADCRWANRQNVPAIAVTMGGKYALRSGLMEIAYNTGAKVILQGPCTYEVESPGGGFLSFGKLTARVEKLSAVSDQQSEIPNPKPQISKFVVRTPTAIVTDLGTEFGVEVGKEGNTTSHVFRGFVNVRVVVGAGGGRDVVLRENESARVVKDEGTGRPRLLLPGAVGNPPKFVRRLVEPPKLLDLLDIVAGGDGTGRRRERGIDPTSGRQDPLYVPDDRRGGRRYWPVPWHRQQLIDGVFVPDTTAGAVQLDSAGHVFDGFLPNSGKTNGSIWARAASIKPQPQGENRGWVYAMGLGGEFMPEKRGLLGMHANAGITFHLEAIRRAHPGVMPARFHAVAGLPYELDAFPPPAGGLANVWVFVDGSLKLKRIGLCSPRRPGRRGRCAWPSRPLPHARFDRGRQWNQFRLGYLRRPRAEDDFDDSGETGERR